MKETHSLGSYQDGHVRVEFCRKCGAEGFGLLENCPQKSTTVQNKSEKGLDEKNQTAK